MVNAWGKFIVRSLGISAKSTWNKWKILILFQSLLNFLILDTVLTPTNVQWDGRFKPDSLNWYLFLLTLALTIISFNFLTLFVGAYVNKIFGIVYEGEISLRKRIVKNSFIAMSFIVINTLGLFIANIIGGGTAPYYPDDFLLIGIIYFIIFILSMIIFWGGVAFIYSVARLVMRLAHRVSVQ